MRKNVCGLIYAGEENLKDVYKRQVLYSVRQKIFL